MTVRKDVIAELSAEMRRQEVAEFNVYLEDRIANARRVCADKKVKGQPIPDYLLQKQPFHVEHSPETGAETKTCKRCKRKRPLVCFPPMQMFKDGSRNTVCQLCLDTKTREAKEKAIEDRQALPQQQLLTIAQRATRMWSSARLRAWRINVPFIMRKKWVEERLRAGRCEVTGLSFSQYGKRDSFTASIDREVPEKGYVESNCRMTVWVYNAAKGSGTHEEVMLLAKALIETEKAARKKRLAAARAASEAGKMENAA
jgi:hypothetical protein